MEAFRDILDRVDRWLAASDRVPWTRPMIVFLVTWFVVAWYVTTGPSADFTILYAAGHPGPVYDVRWLTSLQEGHPGLRPYAYPPTLLLILRPLALLPYGVAMALWSAASATLFVEVTARLVRRGSWLLLLHPVVVWVTLTGQTTLWLGALIVLGFISGPVLAGVLFGAAFAIKPQVMLLLPLMLAVRGEWRTLWSMGLTGLAICAATLPLGPSLWVRWVQSLGEFNAINATLGVPLLGVPAIWLPAAVLGSAALVIASAKADVPVRLVTVIGCSLLCSPHAVRYELAMLVPASMALIARFSWRSLPAFAVYLAGFISPVALAAYVLAIALPLERLTARAARPA